MTCDTIGAGPRTGAGLVLLSVVIAAVPLPAAASTDPELAFGLGYARVGFDDATESHIDGVNGLRADARFSLAPWDELPQLRLGAAFGYTYAISGEEREFQRTDSGGFNLITFDPTLHLFVPELQLSWRHAFDARLSLEVGVGAGAALAYYERGTESSDDQTLAIRPFVRLGYRAFAAKGIAIGVEASYLRGGRLELRERGPFELSPGGHTVGGDVEQWHVGAFLSRTW